MPIDIKVDNDPKGAAVDGRSVCILLVDDEDMVVDIGIMMLERMGYQVIGAKSSNEAVDVFRKHHTRIDVVLLDYMLPDASGAETFKKIREINPDAKVVLSTGFGENQEILDLMKLGCRGVIQKPFGFDVLAEKIKRVELEGDFRVTVAGDTAMGLRLAKNKKPDLILLDVLMPDKDGLEVLKVLKNDAATTEIPVVMFPGVDEDEARMRAAEFYGEG